MTDDTDVKARRRRRPLVIALLTASALGMVGWLVTARRPHTTVHATATTAATAATTTTALPIASTTSTTYPSTTGTSGPAPTTTSTTRPATTTTSTTAARGTPLRPGDRGPAVSALQQRLAGLGYWLGAVDGVYGDLTAHAVVAFEKLHGLSRDGVAGPGVMAALARADRPAARSTTGHVVEIDLARQVLFIVDGGRVRWTLDSSTGRVPGTTPTGRFRVVRQVDGNDISPLGVLYRPKYFSEGVAVHGYPSVPPYPASHGCVRVTNASMDWIWSAGIMPMGTPVWVS
jgi:lipoprotein-anchoring transpeptidase ErfK/SrfK